MLSDDEAKSIVHGERLSSRDQLLVLMAVQPVKTLTVSEVRIRCETAGLRRLGRSNISDTLAKSKGLVARVGNGWELQKTGTLRVHELAGKANIKLVVSHVSQSLRAHAEALNDPLTRSFASEAVSCFEAFQYRAAVVFSWAGAIALLHRFVFSTKLAEFNHEASRRDSRWKTAKQQDDLGRMKEHDFLDVCESLGILGKNAKQLLQNECLTLRNACGHPNSVRIAENSVAAHIEKLIANVYARF